MTDAHPNVRLNQDGFAIWTFVKKYAETNWLLGLKNVMMEITKIKTLAQTCANLTKLQRIINQAKILRKLELLKMFFSFHPCQSFQ